jgi:5-methylcytosine-specific restriction endonuclease McrA
VTWLEEAEIGRLDGLARLAEEADASFAYQIGHVQGTLEAEIEFIKRAGVHWRAVRVKKGQRKLAEEQNWRCCYCGVRMWHTRRISFNSATVEHLIPLGKKGFNTYSNLVAACSKCNNEKGNHSLIHYMNWKLNHQDVKFKTYIKCSSPARSHPLQGSLRPDHASDLRKPA